MGGVAVAYIIPREGATIDPQEVIDYCAGEIANFKVPRYVEIVDEFPMTQSGKIQKFRLREVLSKPIEDGRLRELKPTSKLGRCREWFSCKL